MSETDISNDKVGLAVSDDTEPDLPAASGRAAADGSAARITLDATRSRILWLLLAAFGCVVLFLLYWRQARTNTFDGDAGNNVLQAWDMLHGNILLRGWDLTDVSFYLTELPQYALIETVRGMSPGVAYIAGAMTYTLGVVLAAQAARAARAGTRGREAAVRVLIVLVIMLTPALGFDSKLLLGWPDHLGTGVVLLAIFMVMNRLPARWYAPIVLFALLVWVEVSDSSALLTGSAAVALVAVIRWWRGRGATRIEPAYAVAAVAAAVVSTELVRLIRAADGFHVWPPNTDFVQSSAMPGNVWASVEGYLQLFAADFFGQPLTTSSTAGAQHPSMSTAVTLLHLLGAGLVAWALARGLRRLARETDLLVQLLTVGIALNVVAELLTTFATNGGAREMAAVLPFGAALAGRTLGAQAQVADRRVVAGLSAVALVFSVVLVSHATQPATPAQSHSAEAWLARHGYRYGLGEYWSASSITVDAHGKVAVRPVCTGGNQIASCIWDADTRWYDPAKQSANFLVLDADDSPSAIATLTASAVRQFGPPAQTVNVSGQQILIWHHNLLPNLIRPPEPH